MVRVTVAALLFQLGSAADFGTVHVKGLQSKLHAVNSEWQRQFAAISEDGTSVGLNGGGALLLATTPTAGGDEPTGYYQFQLLGKKLGYTVDLNNVSCSCNAALYLISMPGFNASGKDSGVPDPLGNYYCGANAGKPSRNTSKPVPQSRGNYCPEMDLMEANKFAVQSTPHICNGTNKGPGFYPMCDWHGCATAVWNQSKTALCPEASCTIDTRRPFRHSISFPVKNGVLVAIQNVFEQEGRTFSFGSCQDENAQWTGSDSVEYLRRMTANLEHGMVIEMSLWGLSNQGMSWLDGPTGCKGDCNVRASSVSFSNLTLDSLEPSDAIWL